MLAGAYAQASSNLYYGALRAESAPAAGGRVYAGVTNRTDTLAAAMTSANQSTETMDGEVVFYAYAQASSGWSFAGWSSAPDGAVTRTENPLAVSVACRAKNENVPTTDTVYALFRELQSTMLTLEAPTLLDGTAGGGSYTAQFSDGTNITVTDQARSHATGGTVTLTAHADAGMKFFGWKKLTTTESTESTEYTEYISYEDTLKDYGFTQDCTIRAVFVSEDTPLWKIKGQFGRYASLGEAVDLLNHGLNGSNGLSSSIIALVSNGTLHGSYEIPEGVTMLIPFDKQLSCYRERPVTAFMPDSLPKPDYQEFVRLTLAPDAALNVRGEVSVSALMHAGNGGNRYGSGTVYSSYGRIDMQPGAQMLLQDSARLYCWGFITGQGEVMAQDSSRVYEAFQIPRSRGGNAINSMAGSRKHVFPVSRYDIQNIEASLVLASSATLHVYTSMQIDGTTYNATAPYIGRTGLYRPTEGTVIRKHYDPARDRQVYDIYGDASLAEMQLNIGGYLVNSEVFVLPITNNMDIRIHSGETTVEHQLALLADASITIDEDAALRLKDSTYIYDKDEWLMGMFNFVDYVQPVVYSPTRQLMRDTAMMRDARLDVNGTLLVDSAFYTTKGGANICSSQGTGRIVFNHVSPAADTTWQVIQDDIHIFFKAIPCTAPKLRNAERYAGTAAEYLLTGGARQLAMSNEQLAIGGVQPGDTTGVHHLPQTEASSGEPELRKGSASPHTRGPLWGPQKTVSRGLQPGDTVYNHNGHWGWLRSFEDERSNDYRPDGELSMSEAQMSVAQGQIDGGTSYPRESAQSAVSPNSEEEDTEYINHSYIYPSRSTERVVYAAVCALREEDLPELTFDTEHFIPERTISTGEACVFLGWTEAERDEANQQIITYAQWNCPEEPVDAIEEIEIGGNKEQETRNKKILRDGEIIIITPYHEYNILGVVVK